MEQPRVVQVVGIRGLRGTPGVAPELAIGEAQVAAFFQQDGPVVNVTLSPAGVCWVEFADGASAARAALRDGEVSAGHSLRVTLLHPQPVAQPPQLLGRAPPAEWYGHVQEGNSLVADLAALRVGHALPGQGGVLTPQSVPGYPHAPGLASSLASSRSSSGTTLAGIVTGSQLPGSSVWGAAASAAAGGPFSASLGAHSHAPATSASTSRAYSPSSIASPTPPGVGDDAGLLLGSTGVAGLGSGSSLFAPPPGYGSPVYGSTPPHSSEGAGASLLMQHHAARRIGGAPGSGSGVSGGMVPHLGGPLGGTSPGAFVRPGIMREELPAHAAALVGLTGSSFPSLASPVDAMALPPLGSGSVSLPPGGASTISYAAAAAKARSSGQQNQVPLSPPPPAQPYSPASGATPAGSRMSPAGSGVQQNTAPGVASPGSRPTPQAVAVAAASKLPLAAAISTVHGVPAPAPAPPPARREVQHTCVLKMRGLPFNARKADIVAFFAPGLYPGAPAQSLREESIHIVLEASGRPAGIAFCEFASPDEAKAACQNRHKKSMGPRYVELFASSREEATRVATGFGKW